MTEPENSLARPPSRLRDGTLPIQPVRWGIPDAAIGFAGAVAFIGGTYLLSRASWFPRNDVVGVIVQVLFYLLLGGFVIAVARRRGLGSLLRDFGFELKWVDLIIGIGLFVALHIADVIVFEFAIHVLQLPNLPVSNVVLPRSLPLAVFDALAVASFMAPIVEELFFRGLMMRAVRNFVVRRARVEGPRTTWRAQRVGILVSALVFAAAHLYESQNLTMLFVLGVSIFIFGLAMAAVATRTGRLGPSMIGHMLINGFASVSLLSAHVR